MFKYQLSTPFWQTWLSYLVWMRLPTSPFPNFRSSKKSCLASPVTASIFSVHPLPTNFIARTYHLQPKVPSRALSRCSSQGFVSPGWLWFLGPFSRALASSFKCMSSSWRSRLLSEWLALPCWIAILPASFSYSSHDLASRRLWRFQRLARA